jgi:hypothetical protein
MELHASPEGPPRRRMVMRTSSHAALNLPVPHVHVVRDVGMVLLLAMLVVAFVIHAI